MSSYVHVTVLTCVGHHYQRRINVVEASLEQLATDVIEYRRVSHKICKNPVRVATSTKLCAVLHKCAENPLLFWRLLGKKERTGIQTFVKVITHGRRLLAATTGAKALACALVTNNLIS
jgi:hypothetical protein